MAAGGGASPSAHAAALARVCPGAAFPLLLPADASLRTWSGFVAVRDGGGGAREFALTLENLPGLDDDSAAAAADVAPLAGATLVAGAPLAALLGAGALRGLQRRLRACGRVCDFLVELREAAAAALAAAPGAAPPPPPGFFGALAAQLGALPRGALADVAGDLTSLTLRLTDARGRAHALRCSLPPGFPAHAPALAADLPAPVQLTWRAGGAGSSLSDALAAFAASVGRHQWLWDALDDVDGRAWVLEPDAPPPRAACHRRLSLGGASALWLCLDHRADVAAPLPPPTLRVSGPEHAAAPRRAKLAAALLTWQPPSRAALAQGAWLLDWLQGALGEPLPARPGAPCAHADEAAPPECGICYSFAWPGAPAGERGAPPGAACDNPRCGRPFHVPCLAEWLRADGGAAAAQRAAFGTLFGECPYCSAPIAVAPGNAA